MSLFGPSSTPPTQGIPSTPRTPRANPDRKRREKKHDENAEQPDDDSHERHEDTAELSTQSDSATHPPAHLPAPPPGPERPHLDIQG